MREVLFSCTSLNNSGRPEPSREVQGTRDSTVERGTRKKVIEKKYLSQQLRAPRAVERGAGKKVPLSTVVLGFFIFSSCAPLLKKGLFFLSQQLRAPRAVERGARGRRGAATLRVSQQLRAPRAVERGASLNSGRPEPSREVPGDVEGQQR